MKKTDGKWTDRIQWAAIIILCAACIALAAANIIQDREAEKAQYIGTIPFANQHITWTGAGYNGIWERGGAGK